MSLSATLFGTNSLIFKATNILGLGIPGLLHKAFGPQDPEPTVNAIGDISRQTAKEGDPRTIVWGRVRPIGGNIIHCQSPVKRWIVTSTSSGGKGGGKKKKQEQRTEHVYRTYAIGVCEGPITAFSRIWRNNKLVYDGRGTEWGAKNNGVFLQNFRLYLGGWNQMPSPALQAIWGAGNVPAYRGTAYMVALDEDLTDQGGMVPQWLFEVERAEGIYYTSKTYPVESIDDLLINQSDLVSVIDRAAIRRTNELDSIEVDGLSLGSINLRSITRRINPDIEDLAINGLSAFELYVNEDAPPEPVTYSPQTESIDALGVSVESLSLRMYVIRHSPTVESLDLDGLTLLEVVINGPS